MKISDKRNLRARNPVHKTTRQVLILFVLLWLAFVCTGCEHVSGYLGLWGRQQAERDFQEGPPPELYRYLEIEERYLSNGNDAVFVDQHNGQRSREPLAIKKAGVEKDLAMNGPSLPIALNIPASPPFRVKAGGPAHDYRSLDDDFFHPRYGPMGLYNPRAMLAHTRRLFFSLERFDPEKTIIIFVHGMGGTPRDFKYLMEGLDRNLYQPWFFFYPSGMPLQKLGFMLADIVKTAARTPGVHRPG